VPLAQVQAELQAKKSEQKTEQKPAPQKELTDIEKTQLEIKRWQKEQERLEKVNKELGKIDKNLIITGDIRNTERKWVEEPAPQPKVEEKIVKVRTIYICVPCKRKFNSLVGLQMHLDKSENHMVFCK